MLTISELYIYPVKSLGGISVLSANITDRGFQYDRRWMLVDENNRFLTQREHPQMALLQVKVTPEGLRVMHKKNFRFIQIPFMPDHPTPAVVTLWDEQCEVQFVSNRADEWFTEMLSIPCRLVYMPDESRLPVEAAYAVSKDLTSLSDGYPVTMISQASLDDLNHRLQDPVPMNRFRPNIVFTGGTAFLENELSEFYINNILFYGVKPCSRCVLTTINQDNADMAKEPLKTLASYRQKNNKVYFGENILPQGEGVIKVGYQIKPVD